MRRALLPTALAALAATCCLAGAASGGRTDTAPLSRKLARALAVPGISAARSAAFAVDLTTGEAIFRRHWGLSLAPASTEKLVVTYAALVVLGPSFRVQTTALGHGFASGSTWRGNLVLKGFGDPTLSRARLRALAAQVRKAGVRAVTGRVYGDESFFDRRRTAPGWLPWFFRNECEPLSALMVDRARVRGVVTLRPALAAARAFTRALRAAGVKVRGEARLGRASPRAQPLGTVYSPPLWKLLQFMDRASDNLTAELVLKQLGALYGIEGSTASGAAVVTRILAAEGIPMAGVRIVDGSGLSRLDRLTARALVGILHAAWLNPVLKKAFLAVLPIAGRNGTLRHRMRRTAAAGRVFAKTGTTRISSSLSGFANGRFAFAVIQNGSPVASWWARVAQDRFAAALAAAK